jgi:hypothetical protein
MKANRKLSVLNVDIKMKRNIITIFVLFAILVDFGIGIVVRGSKPTKIPYEVTNYDTEYAPYNEVEVFNDYALSDGSNVCIIHEKQN